MPNAWLWLFCMMNRDGVRPENKIKCCTTESILNLCARCLYVPVHCIHSYKCLCVCLKDGTKKECCEGRREKQEKNHPSMFCVFYMNSSLWNSSLNDFSSYFSLAAFVCERFEKWSKKEAYTCTKYRERFRRDYIVVVVLLSQRNSFLLAMFRCSFRWWSTNRAAK